MKVLDTDEIESALKKIGLDLTRAQAHLFFYQPRFFIIIDVDDISLLSRKRRSRDCIPKPLMTLTR
jgi:hypothetical protein